jgi:hypothetical protein
MTRLRILLFRLGAVLRSRQLDRDIDDEIASHLAEATDEYMRQGLSPTTHAAQLGAVSVASRRPGRSIGRSDHSYGWTICGEICAMPSACSGALPQPRSWRC